MKKNGLIIAVFAIMFSVLIALTGCDEKTEENRKNKDNIIKQTQTAQNGEEKKKTVKDGIYGYVAESEDEEVLEGSVSLEIKDGKIILSDGFAGLVQEGNYKIDGGKLVGNYYSMTYIDHSKGGEYTTKEINDKIEIYILEDGSLRDVVGYGISLDNVMCEGALYKLSEEN